MGGDYYDLLPLSPTRMGVLVADVSGKGTSAALYMAELKGLVLSLSRIYDSPARLLSEANRILAATLDPRSFITMTYAIVDTAARTMRYARAGHNPMIHLEAGTRAHARAHAGRASASASTRATRFDEILEEAEVPLRSGDVFLFFTDGLSEAMNGRAELFGERRLRDVIESAGRRGRTSVGAEGPHPGRDPRLRRRRGPARRHDDGHPQGGMNGAAPWLLAWRRLSCRVRRAAAPAADLVLRGGRVWAGKGLPAATAIAVKDGRVAARGQRRRRRSPGSARARASSTCDGRLVVPGFNDAHVHFLSGGFGLLSVDLRDARDEQDFARAHRRARAHAAQGHLDPGGELGPRGLARRRRCPRASSSTRSTPDHPVFVQRLDGHMALANSLALRLAGVTRESRIRRAAPSCATPPASPPGSSRTTRRSW